MTSRRRPRSTTAALLLLALVLSACGSSAGTSLTGGGSPTATESAPPPAPTAEETPTDAAPLDDHEQALADLAQAREDWAAADPVDYVYELTRSCFCPPGVGGPWTIEVEGGAVTAVVDADGQPVPLDGGVVDFGPIPAVHDAIGEMLDSDPASTIPSGGYDDDGLPVELYVDPSPQMADEEATFTVRLVERLPVPPAPTTTPAPGSGTDAPSPSTDPAAGTTQAGAPITIHIQDEEALVVIDLARLPEGSDVPIDRPCG